MNLAGREEGMEVVVAVCHVVVVVVGTTVGATAVPGLHTTVVVVVVVGATARDICLATAPWRR